MGRHIECMGDFKNGSKILVTFSNMYASSAAHYLSWTFGFESCSKCMQNIMLLVLFYSNGLGACLLDEPQDHDFKFPEMLPGVVYDREWQCNDRFGPTKPCDLGPVRMTSVYNITTFHVVCRSLFFADSIFLFPFQRSNL
jgi:hypothetical protein